MSTEIIDFDPPTEPLPLVRLPLIVTIPEQDLTLLNRHAERLRINTSSIVSDILSEYLNSVASTTPLGSRGPARDAAVDFFSTARERRILFAAVEDIELRTGQSIDAMYLQETSTDTISAMLGITTIEVERLRRLYRPLHVVSDSSLW